MAFTGVDGNRGDLSVARMVDAQTPGVVMMPQEFGKAARVYSLSPVLGGEGWGEGLSGELRYLQLPPLTPALSPEYRGEGVMPRPNRTEVEST